jgi:RNA polymerase sigma factor (sigma-70 family)
VERPVSRENLFLAQLPLIERIISWICGRRGLHGADAEDFASVARSRLIENDYEVLARFEGRSTLKTYLTTVINRIYLDFQVQRFGKWRSSAQARRLGPVAVRLERLLFRDGLAFDEACGVMESDPEVNETRDALYEVSLRLPQRMPRERSSISGASAASAPASAALEQAERQALADRTFSVIRCSLARLRARDRLVLRLHFEAGLTVAEISRSLGMDPKKLYRRRDEILRGLRGELSEEGIALEDARGLLAMLDWNAALTFGVQAEEAKLEDAAVRPSQETGGER